MKWNLVTFADEKFSSRQEFLEQYARTLGMSTFSYNYDWFREQKFFEYNKSILEEEVGLGYFLWKPYVILDAMNKMDDGDLLFYSDVGDMFHPDLVPYVEDVMGEDNSLFIVGGFKNKDWTRRDCFVYMDCDDEDYWETDQLEGGISFWRVCDKSKEIVSEWLKYCSDRRIISDDENVCGEDNFPSFKAHRWDQSVLTNLAVKNELSVAGQEIRNFIECNYDYWIERNNESGYTLGRPIDSLLLSMKTKINA